MRAINEDHIYRFLKKPCNELEMGITIRQAVQQKELAEKSRLLLKKVKQQDSVLQRLEKAYPGLLK